MLNWFKNLWFKIKEFTANSKRSIVDWWYKYRRKIGVIVGVLLYTLCVFFLGYCSSQNDNSTAKADGYDVSVGDNGLFYLYTDIPTPIIDVLDYSSNSNGGHRILYSMFSLGFSVNIDTDGIGLVEGVYFNKDLIITPNTTNSSYVTMSYYDSNDNMLYGYNFEVYVSDYNLPTSDIYGSFFDMYYGDLVMTYIVDSFTNVIVTYEFIDANELYYIDLEFRVVDFMEIFSVYAQKFYYYKYDLYDTYKYSYGLGYQDGYTEGADVGYQNGYTEGADVGYQNGYTEGADVGYQNAINDGQSAGFFGSIAKMVNDLVSVELFPGVPLSYVILIAFGFVALRIILNLFAS